MIRLVPPRSAILLAAIALLVGCSGSPSPTIGLSSASLAPASLAPASVAPALISPAPASLAPTPTMPSAQASPANPGTPSASPTGTIPPFSVASLEAAEPGLDSYRAAFTVGGVLRYQTVIVTKPALAKSINALNPDGTIRTRVIVVGQQAWTASGTKGAFRLLAPATAAELVAAFNPGLLLRSFMGLDWGSLAANQGLETKNGVPARHLRIDASSTIGLAGAMPAGAAIDVWVTPAGDVVAWEMSGFPKAQEISIQVTGFNDPANVVTAPAS